ncbi:hypothetical protein BH11GEM2_BH11GEM2_35110 [soil metagenome]
MVMRAAKTVDACLASLPDDKRSAITTVRDLVLRNLPAGYVEGMGFGMIYYSIPLSRYPDTYNKQPLGYVALAAQKNFKAIYLMGVYGDPERARRFKDGFARAGKRLDIGKSCVRFKSPDDLALDTIAETIAGLSVEAFIVMYERSRSPTQKARAAQKTSATASESRAAKAGASSARKPATVAKSAKSAKASRTTKGNNGEKTASGAKIAPPTSRVR